MGLCIRLLETSSPQREGTYSQGSSAFELAGLPKVTLRFAIETEDPEEVEALRHARRSMLREEWTRGREGEEPSLEDALFSPVEICWSIRPEQQRWCLQKVEELAARANRALADLRVS
jgi:hypothetical protein